MRDIATTRSGGVAYRVLRFLPRGFVDRATRARLRRLARRGHFDGGIAREFATRVR